MDERRRRPHGAFAPRLLRVPVAAGLAVLSATVSLEAIYILVDHLVPLSPAGSSRTLNIIKLTIALGGVVGAVFTGVYAYRKQKLAEADALRSDADHLLGRFSKAADQLGHADAAVRLAGVYAMAALADVWPDQRQMCINVLTSYLQLPEPEGASATQLRNAERAVRRNLIRVIRDHLRDGYSSVSWRGYNLRFEGATFYGGDLSGAHFVGGNINFHAVHFCDQTFHFDDAIIDGARVWFTAARFDGGRVSFVNAALRSGLLDFTGADVDQAVVSFDGFSKQGGEIRLGPFAGQPPFRP
jgi:hypothetical protein